MKKILYFILIFILIIILGTIAVFMMPNISRKCEIKEYSISMKVPFSYEQQENKSENELLNLYKKNNGIRISASKLEDSFWTSGDVVARMDEYLRVISAVNYEASLINIDTEIVEDTQNKIGTISYELINTQGSYRNVAIITNKDIGNVVLEITGSKENMDKNDKEIEKIIETIKIKK